MRQFLTKVPCGRKVAVIRSLVNAKELKETLLIPVLMNGTIVIWKEESSRIRAVQMNNLRGLLDIRRMDKGVMVKGVDERIDEDFLRWLGHVKRMENDRGC